MAPLIMKKKQNLRKKIEESLCVRQRRAVDCL